MSVYLNETPLQEYRSLKEIIPCLNNWSNELNPRFILKYKLKTDTLSLKIFENIIGELHLRSKIKIKEALACQNFDCVASYPKVDVLEDGYLDCLKKHTFTIVGKDPEGNSWAFEVHSTYNSYDSRHYFKQDQKAVIAQ